MKRLLLLVVIGAAMVVSSNAAFGQAGGWIQIYADIPHTSCEAVDAAGFVLLYAVHEGASAKASRWMLDNVGHTMTWFLDQPNGFAAGNGSQGGWAVSYGGCQASPYLIATIWYQALGTSPNCGLIQVVADPSDAEGEITGSDCADNLTFPVAGNDLTVNADGTCPCTPGPKPVEATTWGQLKALYE